VPTAAVTLVLARILPAFVERYPKIEVEVRVENQFVNIVADGLDAGIRLTEAIERDMVQIRLSGPARIVVAGAPPYLARRGAPQKPADLLQHDCVCFRAGIAGGRFAWELERGKKDWRVVLEDYAPLVPGLFLYFPSRAQVSPALRAFVDIARELSGASKLRERSRP
jgi:DNA-binding transcriptional LysR family regulator